MGYIKAFTASWCRPCGAIKKELAVLESDKGVKIEYYDIEQFEEETKVNNVMSVPTLLYVKDGIEMGRTSGLLPHVVILNKLEQLTGNGN